MGVGRGAPGTGPLVPSRAIQYDPQPSILSVAQAPRDAAVTR